MHIYIYIYICFFLYNPFVTFKQIIQQIYVVEEWVRNAHDEVKAEAHSRFEVKKALGALKEEHTELSEKLKEADKACLSTEAGLMAFCHHL